VLQILYILPLSAASAVALNERYRSFFLCSFKTKYPWFTFYMPWSSNCDWEAIQFFTGFLITEIDQGVKLKCSEGEMTTYNRTRAALWLSCGRIMTLTQQKWYLNFTRNSFYIFFPVDQWYSTWAKSSPRGRFHALRGRFCDLSDLRGDFSFQGGDFCRLKQTKILNWFQK